MNAGSLFTGIGGLDVVMESFGIETAWQCENDKHASKVLKRYWPNVTNLGDITKVSWKDVDPVDVLIGGSPCQDISNAGKGAGIVNGTRSGLWRHFADAISVLRPSYVFFENVGAISIRGLDRVLADLAEMGFDAEWCCLQAADVNAPHERQRIFVLATNTHDKQGDWPSTQSPRWTKSENRDIATSDADADGGGVQRRGIDRKLGSPTRQEQGERLQRERAGNAIGDRNQVIADTDGNGRESGSQYDGESIESIFGSSQRHDIDGLGQVTWGKYESAIDRWATVVGPPPEPTDDRGRLAVPFVEWMMGYPAGWVDGISRTQQLKCLGNAVVPLQAKRAFEILRATYAREEAA